MSCLTPKTRLYTFFCLFPIISIIHGHALPLLDFREISFVRSNRQSPISYPQSPGPAYKYLVPITMACPSQSNRRPLLFFISSLSLSSSIFLTRSSPALSNLCTLPRKLSTILHSQPPPPPRAVLYGGGSGLTVPSRGPATAAFIFLHGLGDTAAGWAPAFPLPTIDHVQTILPTADEMPVTMNMGYRMPAWFDLRGLDENAEDDEQGILAAVARVDRIVEDCINQGIPERRIVVGGFSQGGAVALTYGVRTERKIGGIVGLSCWLPMLSGGRYPRELGTGTDLEFWMGHGTADAVVAMKFGERSAGVIGSWERRVMWRTYPGLTHSASPQEMEEVAQFVARVVPKE